MHFTQVCAFFFGTAAVQGMILNQNQVNGTGMGYTVDQIYPFTNATAVETVTAIKTKAAAVGTVTAMATASPVIGTGAAVQTGSAPALDKLPVPAAPNAPGAIGVPALADADHVDDSTKEKVVDAMKFVLEDMLDAFYDFGDVSGVDLESMLADSGYMVKVSPEKRKRSLNNKRFLGFVPGLVKVVSVVLTGVSTVTGILARAQPIFALIGETASAINGFLGAMK